MPQITKDITKDEVLRLMEEWKEQQAVAQAAQAAAAASTEMTTEMTTWEAWKDALHYTWTWRCTWCHRVTRVESEIPPPDPIGKHICAACGLFREECIQATLHTLAEDRYGGDLHQLTEADVRLATGMVDRAYDLDEVEANGDPFDDETGF